MLVMNRDPRNQSIAQYSGFAKDIVDWLAHRLNFT
jgi:hypothetical protein